MGLRGQKVDEGRSSTRRHRIECGRTDVAHQPRGTHDGSHDTRSVADGNCAAPGLHAFGDTPPAPRHSTPTRRRCRYTTARRQKAAACGSWDITATATTCVEVFGALALLLGVPAHKWPAVFTK